MTETPNPHCQEGPILLKKYEQGAEKVPRTVFRAKRIYSITEEGRERLKEWLAVPPQPEIPRNEMLLKLFFGETLRLTWVHISSPHLVPW